jgi:hypothetical protein
VKSWYLPGTRTSWYQKNNSIVEMMKKPDNYTPAPTPTLTSLCPLGDKGECFSYERSNKASVNQKEKNYYSVLP